MSMTVGVVGLGAMGGPIARHLVGAGVPTTVYDHGESAVAALVEQGATAAGSLAEVGACDVVLVVVPSDDDVLDVCEDGLLDAMQPGSVLVVSASVRPETCAALAERAGNVDVLDAALTGGVRGAEGGRVNLLVGGDEVVLDRIRPVLEPWTVAVHHLGPLGAGQVGKTVNNLCHWAQVAVVQEALLLGQRLGVEPAKLRAALLDGPARSGTLAEIEKMRLTWWQKDIDNARAMAQDVGHPLPLTEKVYELMPGITVDRIAAIVEGRDPDRSAAS
jgi:3-hydroxyisobutyrate dehydrogenase-like beta-hydroxyacid dehydrogenase